MGEKLKTKIKIFLVPYFILRWNLNNIVRVILIVAVLCFLGSQLIWTLTKYIQEKY